MGGRTENGDKSGRLMEPLIGMVGRIRSVSDGVSRRLEEKLADGFNLEIQPDGLRGVGDWNRFLRIGVFGKEMSAAGKAYVGNLVFDRDSRVLANAARDDLRRDHLENQWDDQFVKQVGKWVACAGKTKWPNKLKADYQRWVLAMSVWRMREQLLFEGEDLPEDLVNRAKLLQRRVIYLVQPQQRACEQRPISQDMMQQTIEAVMKGGHDGLLQGLRRFVNDPEYY